jgi:hypothetical protein
LINNITAATGVRSPSKQWAGILDLRKNLQHLPAPLLAAFDCVCDYCHMIDETEHSLTADSDTNVVFIERLHHTRISRTICRQQDPPLDISSLPASAFQWPKDLPTPALVIYMVLPHQEREQRVGQESIPAAEYNKIQVTLLPNKGTHIAYYSTVLQCSVWCSSLHCVSPQLIHSKVKGPQFVAIDASGSQEDVLETVLQCCEGHGLYLRKDHNTVKNAVTGHDGAPTALNRPTATATMCSEGEHNEDSPIIINLSDADPPSGGDSSRRESKRQSMGWYGAFMSGGGE